MIVRQGFEFGSVQEIFNLFYGSIINDGNEFLALIKYVRNKYLYIFHIKKDLILIKIK